MNFTWKGLDNLKNKRNQKILSAILALVFILGVTTPGEILASGNYQAESDPKLEIVAFEELAAEIAAQEVPLGTKKSELNLPAILIATVKLAMEDEAAVTDAVYASDDAEFDSIIYEKDVQEEDSSAPGTMEIPVPVSWKSIPEYDGDTAGVYTFRAEISGFALSAVPPVITVTVHEEKLQGTISFFEEFEEDLRWQNTKNPILPEKVKGIVEGKVIDIPVTWEADRDYDQNFPESGLYVFTAKLGEGYVLLPGVEAPRITVYIPPARKMALMMAGNATETDPLIITTAAQISEIATLVNMGKLETFIFNNNEAKVHLKLGRDIDLSSYGKNYRSGKGWMPIGTIDNPFKGQFNGDGKTFAGLYIDDRSLEYAGLFGAVSEGKIENLGLEDIYINGGDYACGLAGYINNVTIERCYVTGTVNGDTAGGITGKVCGNSVICNCYSSVSVSGSSNAGGVAGLIESGSVESCYAMGKVEGSIAGGVAGKIENGKVENCSALNFNIAASSVVARVVGDNQGTLSNNAAFTYMTVTINNNPKLPTDEANGVDGQNIDANGIKADKTIGGRFAPEGGWTTETGKLPGLFGKAVDIPAYIEDKTDPYFIGQGTENEPFLIATAQQLKKLADMVSAGDTKYNSAQYKLAADIDLSEYSTGEGWTPIGTGGNPFKGTFDGNNKRITGLRINRDTHRLGLFGYIDGGTVRNVGVIDVHIYGSDNIGAVAGYVDNNGKVENCYSSGSVSANYTAGGLVGSVYNSSIVQNCYSTANVKSNYNVAGGIAG